MEFETSSRGWFRRLINIGTPLLREDARIGFDEIASIHLESNRFWPTVETRIQLHTAAFIWSFFPGEWFLGIHHNQRKVSERIITIIHHAAPQITITVQNGNDPWN